MSDHLRAGVGSGPHCSGAADTPALESLENPAPVDDEESKAREEIVRFLATPEGDALIRGALGQEVGTANAETTISGSNLETPEEGASLPDLDDAVLAGDFVQRLLSHAWLTERQRRLNLWKFLETVLGQHHPGLRRLLDRDGKLSCNFAYRHSLARHTGQSLNKSEEDAEDSSEFDKAFP